MNVKLWGTRGSIPTPSTPLFLTSQYGGDTTCVSIESGEHILIIDGGSGLRLLGLELNNRPDPIHATFFFSHVHWDHIQGFPFFIPGFQKDNHFQLYGPRLEHSAGFVGSILEKALRGQQENLNFPVQLKDMPARMEFQDILHGSEVVLTGGATELVIKSFPLNHPGGCFGHRVEEWESGKHRSTFAFATDTEHLEDINPNVQSLIQSADLVLYDSQYTPEEYVGANGGMPCHGWGHSTWEMAIRECRAAEARHLLLHHHDPMHNDDAVGDIERKAQDAAASLSLEVEAAQQFKSFKL